MTAYTTEKAQQFLREQRNLDIKVDTIKHWCQRGVLPGAYRVTGVPGRGYWLIPEEDLLAVVPPVRGRKIQQQSLYDWYLETDRRDEQAL